MRPVSPNTAYPEVMLGEAQPEFRPLVAAVDENGPHGRRYLTRWRLSNADREAIACGEDLALVISSPAFPPVILDTWSGLIEESK